MFTTRSLFGTDFFPRQRIVLVTGMLAVSLFINAAAPAWAISKNLTVFPSENIATQADYSGVIRGVDSPPLISASIHLVPEYPAEVTRAIDAYPDVVVFPIRVADISDTPKKRSLANKIAEASGSGSIAVIYPDIGEPYRSVFTQILDGIQTKRRVSSFAVGQNENIGVLNSTLHSQNTKVVIALGRQGVKVASTLDSNLGIVAGGVLTATENEVRDLQVHSLSPDPALLFSRLKGLMPAVRRVFTVYDPRQNAWMMRLAKEAARVQGLEFTAYEAQNLRSAMHAYQEILVTANSSRDALWLPQDSTTVENSTVLPMVLQESWTRNLAVFSSSFDHVRRGVLFSLYPNNVELGRHLANSALDLLASGKNEASGLFPLREVLMAVNLRTAKHLELNTSRPQSFDLTFPEH